MSKSMVPIRRHFFPWIQIDFPLSSPGPKTSMPHGSEPVTHTYFRVVPQTLATARPSVEPRCANPPDKDPPAFLDLAEISS